MRNNVWVFGHNAGLDFSSGAPVASNTKPINSFEGCATLCNPFGYLIAYSDGLTVWDGSGTVRLTGMPGHGSSTQAALLLPDPSNGKRIYLITSHANYPNYEIVRGRRINLTNWTATPVLAFAGTINDDIRPTERLTAVRHVNGKHFWILTVIKRPMSPTDDPESIQPGFLRVFLLTGAGVTFVGDQPLGALVSNVGYLKASAKGQYVAFADMCTQRVNLMQFSNSTGLIQLGSIVTIPVKVPPFQTNGYVYGLEFSKSGRLLYYSTLWPLPIPEVSHIFQYFISTGVETLVGSRPNTAGLSLTALQLAPDGKIYIAQDGEEVLGVITSPETPGLGCNVQFAAVPLSVGSFGTHGLPNHVRDLM